MHSSGVLPKIDAATDTLIITSENLRNKYSREWQRTDNGRLMV